MNATDEHQDAIDRLRDELTAFIAAQGTPNQRKRPIPVITARMGSVRIPVRKWPLCQV